MVKALSKAMALVNNPERNKKVKVIPKSGGQGYEFSYATLSAIMDVIRKPLTDNGLWFTQIMKEDQGAYILDTRLMHESGQWIACQTPLIWDGHGGNQQFGSALTFMRRYALTSLLGIAAEEDDDANAADGNEVVERKPVAPKEDVMAAAVEMQRLAPPSVLAIDEDKPDWATWGKSLIACIKGSANYEEAERWYVINDPTIMKMSEAVPKMYTNFNTSVIKIMNDLKNRA